MLEKQSCGVTEVPLHSGLVESCCRMDPLDASSRRTLNAPMAPA